MLLTSYFLNRSSMTLFFWISAQKRPRSSSALRRFGPPFFLDGAALTPACNMPGRAILPDIMVDMVAAALPGYQAGASRGTARPLSGVQQLFVDCKLGISAIALRRLGTARRG